MSMSQTVSPVSLFFNKCSFKQHFNFVNNLRGLLLFCVNKSLA